MKVTDVRRLAIAIRGDLEPPLDIRGDEVIEKSLNRCLHVRHGTPQMDTPPRTTRRVSQCDGLSGLGLMILALAHSR